MKTFVLEALRRSGGPPRSGVLQGPRSPTDCCTAAPAHTSTSLIRASERAGRARQQLRAGQHRDSGAGTVSSARGASPNRVGRTGLDRVEPSSSTGRAVPAPVPQSRPARGGAQPVRWVRRRSGQRGADRNGAVRSGGRCRRLPGARRAGRAEARRWEQVSGAGPAPPGCPFPSPGAAAAGTVRERSSAGSGEGAAERGVRARLPRIFHGSGSARVSLSQAGRWLLSGYVLEGEVFPRCHFSERRSHPEGIHSSVAVRGSWGLRRQGGPWCVQGRLLCAPCALAGRKEVAEVGCGKPPREHLRHRAWLQDGRIPPRNPFISIFLQFLEFSPSSPKQGEMTAWLL